MQLKEICYFVTYIYTDIQKVSKQVCNIFLPRHLFRITHTHTKFSKNLFLATSLNKLL